MKKITHPTTGKTLYFGRKAPVVSYPKLSLKNYLTKTLPSPPASVTYDAAAMPALKQMYGNDIYGDCVIASQAHVVGVLTGNAGQPPAVFTDDQIVSRYTHIGGYVPGDPSTDQGADMQTALSSWQNVGMMPMHLPANKHRIVGWAEVNPFDVEEMKTAIWLFENLLIGVDLPDAWISPPPPDSGFTWDVAGPADPWNGHAFCGLGYSDGGVEIDTWGMLGVMTWPAFRRYVGRSDGGELYTAISKDSIDKAKQKAPNGFSFSQLLADFQAIGGTLE